LELFASVSIAVLELASTSSNLQISILDSTITKGFAWNNGLMEVNKSIYC
jgi:hypothetical protein